MKKVKIMSNTQALENFIENIKRGIEYEREHMQFNFRSYKLFCYDFKIKPSHYKSLQYFKRYINGDLDVIFEIEKGE